LVLLPLAPILLFSRQTKEDEEQPYLADGMRREENATTIAEEI
jgi:hypothetical protein